MTITAEHIGGTLDAYLGEHWRERRRLAPVRRLLRDGADLTSRTEFRGHATAGAVVVGADRRVLHIHHLATGRWLMPGGHLDAVDPDLRGAALRELAEETGIPVAAVTPAGDRPIQIDVHHIPPRPGKGEPEHWHFDFRFLFRTAADVGELQAEEIAGSVWRDIADLRDKRLRRRVAAAVGTVRSAP